MNREKENALSWWFWDLQFFAEEEKTEEPTARKRAEARRRGQVPRSMEFNSVLVVLVAFCALNIFGASFLRNLYHFFLESFRPEVLNLAMDESSLGHIFLQRFLFILVSFLPVGLTVLAAGVAINLVQTGGIITGETLKMRWDRVNPAQGLKRLFSPR